MMTPAVGKGDAVSNDAKEMTSTLRLAGYEVDIFTNTPPSADAARVYSYDDVTWKLDRPSDIIIYHYCIHDQAALTAIRRTNARVILKYHNVTPSAFFLNHTNEYLQGTKLGRSDLRLFLELPIICTISDSNHNRDELLALGVDRVKSFVLAPLSHTDDLLACMPDRLLENHLRGMQLNLLSVGRIVPNKRQDFLITALALLNQKANMDVHLHLVGKSDPRLASYKQQLDALIAQHNLTARVHFYEDVTIERLATFYRVCDLYWTGSEHEGFCVPAAEAMSFGLPILATPAAAMAETCGEAAIYGRTEQEHAELLQQILTNDVERNRLGMVGRRRFSEKFANPVLRSSLLEVFAEIVQYQVDTPYTSLRRNWLYLPNFTELAAEIILAWTGPAMFWTEERDHYLDVIAWALRTGQQRSPYIRDYFRSAFFNNYLLLEFRSSETQQTVAPIIRFIYAVSRRAQSYFVLRTDDAFISFASWFYRKGAKEFGVEDLIQRENEVPLSWRL